MGLNKSCIGGNITKIFYYLLSCGFVELPYPNPFQLFRKFQSCCFELSKTYFKPTNKNCINGLNGNNIQSIETRSYQIKLKVWRVEE